MVADRHPLTVHTLDPLKDDRWTTFLDCHRDASIFHDPGWLRALQRTCGFDPVVYTTDPPGGPLTNGIPFCRVDSRLTGRRLVSLPFSDHCEPLGPDECLPLLFARAEEDAAREKRRYVEIRPLRHRPGGIGESDTGLRVNQTFHLHKIDLSPDLDAIRARFHGSSVARKIRRSRREGLACSVGRSPDLLEQFYGLFIMTRRRHRTVPHPKRWFRNLVDGLEDHIDIYVARRGTLPVASIIVCKTRTTHYYKYGCSDPRYTNLGGTAMLFDQAITAAKQGGAVRFDLGRSDTDQPGLAVFKERWGAERFTLTYYRGSASRSDDGRARSGRNLALLRRMMMLLPDRALVAAGSLFFRHLA